MWDVVASDRNVRAAYYELMSGYDRALAEASRLGQKGEAELERAGEYVSPSLAQRLVKAHINRKLGDLGDSYLQLAATFPAGEPRRDWLVSAVEDARRIATSLPRLRFPPFALLVLVPPLVLRAADLLGGNRDVILGVVGILVLVAGYIFLVVRDSYRCKREILLPEATKVDRLGTEQQRRVLAGNVYATEDRAFGAIGRGKRPEAQVDRLIGALVAFLLAEAPALILIVGGQAYLPLSLVLLASIVGLFTVLRRLRFDRVWL